MARVESTVERVVYYNETSGYTVARLDDGSNIVGVLPNVQPGESIRVEGDWTNHPKYGRQFKVTRCEQQSLPTTTAGIETYLGSDLIEGVSAIGAIRITRHFGSDTLRVLDEEPDRLQEVHGIGPERAAAIAASWRKHRDIREMMMFLQGHGVATGLAVKIHGAYGADAVRVVQENPYRLARDIRGVGFTKADHIARELGLAADAPFRVQAGVIHVLRQQARAGSVFTPLVTLVCAATDLLSVAPGLVGQAIEDLTAAGDIHCEGVPEQGVYLGSFHDAETGVVAHLRTLIREPAANDDGLDELLARVGRSKRKSSIELSDEQWRAVRAALSNKVAVLTGGPGTGKTETVRIIIAALRALKKHYALCAPTGRAAKRLAEATGRPAQTIHRLLEYNPEAGFVRDERDPLTVDYLIVDEASMLDLELAHHLLEALKPAARVLFVGDVNQLPSVGAGDVLRDLIRSGRAAVVQLTTIFRQAADSGIVVNAHRINQGQFPILNEFGGFYFFGEKRPKQAADLLVDIVGRRIPEKFGLYPIDDVQVLAPMYRGACGVDDLNARLQEALNPAGQGKAERRLGERVFRVGDKVMQTRNDYDRMVFNGDVGRIAAVDPVLKEMAVLMPGRGLIHYDWDEIGKLTHAFATTIHKAQGAEYPCVVVPLLTQHYVMLQRNLLYTAITRARRLATAWHHVGKLVSRRRRLRSVQFPGA